MNKNYIFKLSEKNRPNVRVNEKEGWRRHDIVKELQLNNNIGIELGVAAGTFSKRIIDSEKFSRYYGVDIYGDWHDTSEYKQALLNIGLNTQQYCLLRMDFDSALDMFPDHYFDFIYIDGFAHTGEEGGKSLVDWYPKLKVGGIIAGDDYHNDWPLVVWAVNHFSKQLELPINVTTVREEESYCKYPSWFIRKDASNKELSVDPLLYKVAMKEKKRIASYQMGILKSLIRKAHSLLDGMGVKKAVKKILKK